MIANPRRDSPAAVYPPPPETRPLLNGRPGDDTAVPVEITTDLLGQPRFGNGVVDMGAYEFLGRLRNAPRVPITAPPPTVNR